MLLQFCILTFGKSPGIISNPMRSLQLTSMSSVIVGDTSAWILWEVPFAPAVRDVVPEMDMHSPFAATNSVCSLFNISSLCCTANFSLIIVFVQPVSGVAAIWNAAPVHS